MTKTFPKQPPWMMTLLKFMLILGIMMASFPGLTATVFAQSFTSPELPRILLDTTYSPPTGQIISVANGGNFQAALNTAQPGNIIELEAGATFTGNFVLPNKIGTGWIYIRSSAHASLPSPGTRVSPAQANLMSKIVSPNTNPAITTDFGTHNYRFIGIEITTTWASTTATHTNLILLGYDLLGNSATSLSQLPYDITFDRCYIHGTPQGNVRRGILLNSIRTAVIDSYLSDFHEVGADAQALLGINGPGPFKIVNNELQGSGENVMFGGGDPNIANLIPSDIEIRGNHFFKPRSWKVGDPSYAGIHWSVKNLLEFKNAQRVWVDGNILENNWADAQGGMSVLITPRNQNGGCPWCVAQDITFTHNILRHAGNGISILATDNNFPTQPTTRILIKDNLLDDISSTWGGNGRLFQILPPSSGSWTSHLTIDHNTGFENMMISMTDDGGTMVKNASNFIFRNNITPTRQYGFFGTAASDGNLTLNTYYVNPVYTNNAMAGGSPSNYSNYPGNFFPASDSAVGFVNLAGGDYHLSSSSPYKNAGTDGKDLGADIDALNAATSCALTGACGSLPPSDTTPPTVSITSPGNGATVSGIVTVSADATDNVGLVGVQFKLDGANLGAEDTTVPYSISWDTTTAINGSHTLTAVARDAAGNTNSAAATVTVANNDTTPPAPPKGLTVK